jgi:MoxR-like ATPase
MIETEDLMPEIEAAGERLVEARRMIARRIIGQEAAVEQALIAILCGGHGLLVGVPGLAKTRLVETLGTVLGLVAHRVQFTPDLMPADILGAEVLETGADGSRAFRFIDGPVFCQLLMADEINRASPRTQSALLQAMQEKEVSVAGQRRILPQPFHVLATQNPIEQEGTYPLPEAQLDRFMLELRVGYPSKEEEESVVERTTGSRSAVIRPVLDAVALRGMQQLVRRIPVSKGLVRAAVSLARMTRPQDVEAPGFIRDYVEWGAGPRASQYLVLGAKARAAMDGRPMADLDDVKSVAAAVLRHRVVTNFSAEAADRKSEDIVAELVRGKGWEAAH